jgi:hypothetical protein
VSALDQHIDPFETRDRIKGCEQVLLLRDRELDVGTDDVGHPSGISKLIEQRRGADVVRLRVSLEAGDGVLDEFERIIRADSASGAVTASGGRRPARISAETVFQSAAPNIFETSSRLSLWLIVTALEVRESREVCAMAFASPKSRKLSPLRRAKQACQVVALLTRSLGQRMSLKA